MFHALQMHEHDNVATVVEDIQSHTGIVIQTTFSKPAFEFFTVESIPFGHKIALLDIRSGETVTKYGRPIGRATQFIAKGSLVGVHNIEGQRGRGDVELQGGTR
ncbi:UxaA family hydrolase [Alicyclobacillus tolerans]|uniref:UxaA family hydrolase n=1 Tax=Alicyclobacillus tolerans TaxID=90970 RepID=UPI001F31A194|nr:UxaA family hydrolase [Alicyclobacillus tolerans]MCF8565577.1 UxaA family hydrolase [Alicyclobacillus tolerans]